VPPCLPELPVEVSTRRGGCMQRRDCVCGHVSVCRVWEGVVRAERAAQSWARGGRRGGDGGAAGDERWEALGAHSELKDFVSRQM